MRVKNSKKSSRNLSAENNNKKLLRRRRAAEEIIDLFPGEISDSKIEQIKELVRQIARRFDSICLGEQSLEREDVDNEKVDQAIGLMGRNFNESERFDLEIKSVKRYFDKRHELLQNTLTASSVSNLLNTSRQTPHDRLKSGTLLAVMDKGMWRFPKWQFDPDGPNGVIEGLPEVLQALDMSPLSKIYWFLSPNPFLDRLTPLEALKKGLKEKVLEEAIGAGGPR